MELAYGWAGRMLLVDLSRQKVVVKDFYEWRQLAYSYIGGRGINSRLIYDLVDPKIDPLSPENVLIFGVGPLVGTMAPACSRFTVSAKSPLTYTLGDTNAGGHFAAELKFAGYDHIIFTGRSDKPVYLWIDDGDVELRDASKTWGKDTWETQDEIREEVGDPDVKIACIGPAGERLVRFACIIHGSKRAGGRTGMGCVMGSKRLKAVAVRGSRGVQIAKPDEFENAVNQALEKLYSTPHYHYFSKFGTRLLVRSAAEGGWLTTRNAQTGYFEGAEKLFEEVFERQYRVGSVACFNCPIHCGSTYEVSEGPYKGTHGEGPEFNVIFEFGPNLGVDYYPAILKANELVNRYGLDADGTGCNIAFVMELLERRVLNEEEVGLPLKWGNYEAVLKMIEMIATRKGFGDVLAEGMKKAAEKIGRGAEKYARVVKGMEVNNELRGRKGYALAYAVATRGPDHLRGAPNVEYFGKFYPPEVGEKLFGTANVLNPRSYDGKPQAVVWTEHVCAIADAVGMCKFATAWNSLDFLMPRDIAKILSSATGWDVSEEELLKIGERIVNLERCINVRDGYSRKDDTLPERQLKEPCPSGPAKGEVVSLSPMLDEYYKLRGWDLKTGIPTEEKLKSLGLDRMDTVKFRLD